ncbi:uncharacterized protein LOC119735811 [Patiria miniata]|uniref:Uncharacterized protein n=1 Tax=Patiria miniata TaxID=46514 RepID=A0A914AQG4_PATMI|nr:uncharacterized protein LOC119735811 [Patiria miniata]
MFRPVAVCLALCLVAVGVVHGDQSDDLRLRELLTRYLEKTTESKRTPYLDVCLRQKSGLNCHDMTCYSEWVAKPEDEQTLGSKFSAHATVWGSSYTLSATRDYQPLGDKKETITNAAGKTIVLDFRDKSRAAKVTFTLGSDGKPASVCYYMEYKPRGKVFFSQEYIG